MIASTTVALGGLVRGVDGMRWDGMGWDGMEPCSVLSLGV